MTAYYYFEINKNLVTRFGSKYLFQDADHLPASQQIMYASDRIWKLDCSTNRLSWVKNRTNPNLPIDEKEFFLVQLKAKRHV